MPRQLLSADAPSSFWKYSTNELPLKAKDRNPRARCLHSAIAVTLASKTLEACCNEHSPLRNADPQGSEHAALAA